MEVMHVTASCDTTEQGISIDADRKEDDVKGGNENKEKIHVYKNINN